MEANLTKKKKKKPVQGMQDTCLNSYIMSSNCKIKLHLLNKFKKSEMSVYMLDWELLI